MISKVLTGHSFGPACGYICNKQGAKVLAAEGVRAHDYKKMANDFIIQHGLHPSKKQACFHAILSFYPGEGEKLRDEKMLEIAKRYLEEIGIKDTQYAIAKHTDRAHHHLHIIANLVNNNGEVINDSWIGLHAKKTAQKLTEAYKLVPAKRKNIKLSHPESLNESEANRYKIYEAILHNLPHCRNMKELEKRLARQKITTVYKYKGQTNEKQGVSFQIGKDCFKGSKIDRKFSLGNLEKYFSFQQQQRQQQKSKYEYHSSPAKTDSESTKSDTAIEIIGKEISGLIAELMKPEYGLDYGGGYSTVPKKRKKKKKKKGYLGYSSDSQHY